MFAYQPGADSDYTTGTNGGKVKIAGTTVAGASASDSSSGDKVGATIAALNGTSVTFSATANTGHIFSGWYTALVGGSCYSTSASFTRTVTSDLTLYARFTPVKYTLKVAAGTGGAVTGGGSYTYGSEAAISATANEGYTFSKWTLTSGNSIIASATSPTTTVTVKSATTVTASFTKNSYQVIFKNYDGTTLATRIVYHGAGTTAPTVPAREGYTFTGWDKDITNVTENMTVTPQFVGNEAPSYTVTFVNWDGTVLDTQVIKEGASAAEPEAPTREGNAQYTYTFTGWDKDFDYVTEDITVSAVYEQSLTKHTIKFLNYNGTVLHTEEVEFGKSANGHETTPVRPNQNQYKYIFIGWSSSVSYVTCSMTVYAQYEQSVIECTVTFLGYEGTVLKEEALAYGEIATAPEVPEVDGYTFMGWDKEFTGVTEDITVTAQYVANSDIFTVEFCDSEGRTLKIEKVIRGGDATPPEPPELYGHEFTGWGDMSYTNVTSSRSVFAQYTLLDGFVSLYVLQSGKGTVSGEATYPVGTVVEITAAPEDGYTFTGWKAVSGNEPADLTSATTTVTLTESTHIKAVFEINTYTVSFVDWNGNVLSTQTVEYGSAATAPTNPKRNGYIFTGWDVDFSNITKNTTVTAKYIKSGSLKVEILGGTGFSISIDEGKARPQGPKYANSKIPVGAEVVVVANTTTDAEFIGWMNSVTGAVLSTDEEYSFTASGNDSINASYNVKIEGVQMVNFKNDKAFGGSGRLLDSQYYAADDSIMFPDDPTQIGFDFTDWNMTEKEIQDLIANNQDVTVVPVWERQIIPVNVTVNGGTGSGTYNANAAVTVVANEAAEGEKFAYWTDANGNIKSYSQTYKFFPSTDTTVTAVFVAEDTEIDYQILVSIDSIDTATVAEKNVFYYSWYCPEEYTFVKVGILAVNKDNYTEETFVAGTSDSNVFDRSPSGTIQSVSSASWTKSNVTTGQTWVAMAYVQYRDAQGDIVTVYSDMVEAVKE